jgi:hypothetical protein
MRMIIAGSRTITSEADYQSLKQFVMQGAKPDEIVSGGAKGPDLMGERLAAEFGIPVKRFIPDWQNPDGSTNRGAGFIRNGTMAVYASEEPNGELVVLWDGTSAGTTQMMKVATTYGLRVRQVPLSVDTAGLIALRDITPKEPYIFPQSYSSLSVFETCPRQYEAKYLTKEVPYVQTPAAAWGDLAHSHLEQYLKAGGQHHIPGVVPGYEAFGPMNAYQRFADWVLNRAAKRGGTVLAERSAAVDLSHNPVAYKSKTRWIGGKIDVTILYPQECAAEVFDWKTGKVKNDATQLKLYNNFALADYPTINTASAGYIWLAQDSISPPVFSTRDELESNWSVFEHKYAGLKAAYRSGVFPAKPNGLCAKYCDVTSCEHHGRGRR